jgi:hypothetical protein
MLLKWSPGEVRELPDHVAAQLKELAAQLPPWRIVNALRIWGEANLRHDAPSTLPLELAAVEICSSEAPSSRPAEPTGARGAPAGPRPGPAAARTTTPSPPRAQPPRPSPVLQPKDAARPAATPGAASPSGAGAPPTPGPAKAVSKAPGPPAVRAPAPAGPQPAAANGPGGPGDLQGRWLAVVKALDRDRGKKYMLGPLLRDCRAGAVAVEGDTLVLPFANQSNLERMQEELADPKGRQLLTEAVARSFGTGLNLRLTLAAGAGSGPAGAGRTSRQTQQSPLVRAAQGMGARIIREVAE